MSTATVVETMPFEGSVIERTEDRHEGSGVLREINREFILHRVPIIAVDVDMARVELISQAKAKKKGLNTKMLEVTLYPFQV